MGVPLEGQRAGQHLLDSSPILPHLLLSLMQPPGLHVPHATNPVCNGSRWAPLQTSGQSQSPSVPGGGNSGVWRSGRWVSAWVTLSSEQGLVGVLFPSSLSAAV